MYMYISHREKAGETHLCAYITCEKELISFCKKELIGDNDQFITVHADAGVLTNRIL